MEEVCLNSEPVFDECDEYDVEGDGSLVDNNNESEEAQSKKNPPLPTVGLEFDSFDEAYDFYNIYARDLGFGIRVSNSWFRSKRKERYRAKLSCSSAGFKKKSEANNPRPETRTGCPAMIIIKLIDIKRWRIVELQLEHNHPVSPQITRFYKSHKKMILAAKKAEPQPHHVTEVHTIKLYRTTVLDSGGNECSNVDQREVISSVDHSRHLELKDGDGHALYNYFCRMQLTNSNFFYSMDLDNDGHLRNVFWADARSRAAYYYFCDTITIDTTCLANKYEIPLVSFVGVNHHGQSVLLGCGFVGFEAVEYFVWILKAWLRCMLAQSPQVIITDQNKILSAAVSEVFPKACHCYSMWYIMQRVPEKLGGLTGYGTIRSQLNKTIFSSLKIAEFETLWTNMIKQNGLGENKWLQSLYEDRKLWAPVYLKDVFFAGMVPIHANESFNAFFDGCVHKHTSVKEFVDKYDLALHRKHHKESVADLESRNSSIEVKTRCNFELQLAKVYTKEIFSRFRSEVEGMYSCFNTRQVNVNGPLVTYVVKERIEVEGNEKEVRCFEVLYETTERDIRCICSLFNYKGYLCRHALNVLNYNGVEEIPARYVLPRWCKDFKRRDRLNQRLSNTDLYSTTYQYNHILNCALPVVEEGAQSQEHYKLALQELDELLNKLHLVEDVPNNDG